MDSTTPKNLAEVESCILGDGSVKQAKVLDLAAHGADGHGWTAALVLGDEAKEADAATIIKRKWVVLDHLPTGESGLVDEGRLAQHLTTSWTARRGLSAKERREGVLKAMARDKETDTELVLKAAWAQVLRRDAEQIRRNDSFLLLSGDSILAIELAAVAQEYGIGLSTRAILQNPELSGMARVATVDEGPAAAAAAAAEERPFSALDAGDREAVVAEVRRQCGLAPELGVADVFPCSALQEGLMALAVKQPGSSISRAVWRLGRGVDVGGFRRAWEATVELCANLRTRIVLLGEHPLQAVIEGEPVWAADPGQGICAFVHAARAVEMGYGSRLCRSALVDDIEGTFFVLMAHHSVFDGISIRLVLDTLHRVYQGLAPRPLLPYAAFVRYMRSLDVDAAAAFWRRQLEGARQAAFPSRRGVRGRSHVTGVMKRTLQLPSSPPSSITKATVLRAAWALVMACYCDTDDVCFGTTVSGRHAPVPGLQTAAGPVIATVPVRLRLDPRQPVADFLRAVQAQASDMVAFEQFGLHHIAKVCAAAKDACDFRSLLVIQPLQHLGSTTTLGAGGSALLRQDTFEQALTQQSVQNYFNYPLVVQPWLGDSHVELDITYDSDALSEFQLEALTRHLDLTIRQLLARDQAELHHVWPAGPWDAQQALDWNSDEQPDLVDVCVHSLIEEQARARPHALAIQACDAELTYGELNRSANRLACHLASFDLAADDVVHVCFEKSAWFFVAVLAINKAGAAWSPLDPSRPFHHHQQVVRQTEASLALCSPAYAALCADLVPHVVEVCPQLDQDLASASPSSPSDGVRGPAVATSPRSAAYVLFTSGSTGIEKGFVMEHRSLCTSQTCIGQRLGIRPGVKMLQYSAFDFNLAIGEIFCPLVAGACLCVPSEDARADDIAGYIRDVNASWIFLTPSLARTLSPSAIPNVELLLLYGEAPAHDILHTWIGKVRLFNAWGPAETGVFSALHEWKHQDESPLTVGRPVGSSCWIVDPDNPERLAPIGTVGEVLVQGPTVMREYLSDPASTQESMLEKPPSWAVEASRPWSRLFKSGNLCYYNPDGTIEYCGRKDAQVEIRGLRLEPSEIEYQIRKCLAGVVQVAVDVLRLSGSPALVSYLCFSDRSHVTSSNKAGGEELPDLFTPLTDALRAEITALVGHLNVVLPAYMVPTVFIPCALMPYTTSQILDRNWLRRKALTLTTDQLARYSLVDGDKRPPETPMERRLLKISPDAIGRDDSFIQLGGDSIAAIVLVNAAHEARVSLSVQDIFTDPRLLQVALKARELDAAHDSQTPVGRFGLVGDETRRLVLGHAVRDSCHLLPGQIIEDAFPCTGIQEGLIALSSSRPGSYVTKYAYRLLPWTDVPRFVAAWEKTLEVCENLRTRIVLAGNLHLQLVVRGDVEWEPTDGVSLESFMHFIKDLNMSYGSKLCRYALISDGGANYFIWMIHHSIQDGWTIKIVLDTVYDAYYGNQLPTPTPYSNFVKYTMDLDAEKVSAYWRTYLAQAKRSAFPPARSDSASGSVPTEPKMLVIDRKMPLRRSADPSITAATVMRAAWGLVLARHSDLDDITFGSTVSWRQAVVCGIDKMAGPLIATVPVRVRVDKRQAISSLLQTIQSEASDMVPYEQFGLQSIAKVSPEAKEVCDLSSLLVIQPGQQIVHSHTQDQGFLQMAAEEQAKSEEAMENYFNYTTIVMAYIYEDHALLRFVYNAHILSEAQMVALASQLEVVVQQLLVPGDATIDTISQVSRWDLELAITSQRLRPSTDACINWAIKAQVEARPEAPAIVAWDGELSFEEVGDLTSRVANKLQSLGVGPGTVVPIFMPKSAWAAVAMASVVVAGGAFASLDVAAPPARLKGILEDTKAKHVIVAASTDRMMQELGVETLLIDESFVSALPRASPASLAKPDDPSVILFTSGSTGKPKGMIIPHRVICTAADASGPLLGFGPGNRIFQFAAFTFDNSVFDVFFSLIRGACVCIPSEEQRMNDLAGAINAFGANVIHMTPTVADLLSPEDVPGLKKVCLTGEAISAKSVDRWRGKVALHASYGPAETSVCAWRQDLGSDARSTNIGYPLFSSLWVVEPDNMKKLVPVGCVDELIIEGPLLAAGYLNVQGPAAANFIERADWLPGSGTGATRRAYRSGDLVRRNVDGTFDYIGRKDFQVKIHGQRVELGEIEAQLQIALPGDMNGIIGLADGPDGPSLMAFLWFTGGPHFEPQSPFELVESLSPELRKVVCDVENALSAVLPVYMVPAVYPVFRGIPERSVMGKVNRRALVERGNALSPEKRSHYAPEQAEKEDLATPMELQMRDLWAEVLNIPADKVSNRNGSFLRLGGDSVSAVRLVALARRRGISLTVSAIFKDPRLSRMAALASTCSPEAQGGDAPPKASLSPEQRERVQQTVESQCGLSASQIEDIYPCTKMQEGLMSLAVKQPGSYIAKLVYRVSEGTDLERFKKSWERVVASCAVLRTRITHVAGATLLVVVAEDLVWEDTDGMTLSSYLTVLEKLERSYGSRMSQSVLVSGDDGETYFIWANHHAVCDGWTRTVIMRQLDSFYNGREPEVLQPYSSFVGFTSSLDAEKASAYWRDELRGAKRATFPPTRRGVSSGASSSRVTRAWRSEIPLPSSPDISVTKASVLRAAWTILMARYCNTDDVCFGQVVSGRNAPLPGLDVTAGPMIATVPFRMQLDREQEVSQFLSAMQEKGIEMVPYEQFGLQAISKLSTDAQEACSFTSLMVVRPKEFDSANVNTGSILNAIESGQDIEDATLNNFFNYPLICQFFLSDDLVNLLLIYDADVLAQAQLAALSNQLSHIVEQLSTAREKKRLGDMPVSSPWDIAKAIEWNQSDPETVNSCLHELVEAQARLRPEAPALCGWDAQFTYRELDGAANRLAHYIRHCCDVEPGDMIIVCFERSAWYVVATLAVNKAGAAWLPLDPSHPAARHRQIAQKAGAKLALASSACRSLCTDLVGLVIEVTPELDQELARDASRSERGPVTKVLPENAAYGLFTSGSTGTPKGFIMEHRSVCTSMRYIGERLRVTPRTRYLQFAASVFDASVGEVFATLRAGGCVCVPSEHDRMNRLKEYIQDFQVNMALLTPSVTRTLRPSDIPSLQVLVLGGEAVGQDILDNWFGKLRLINGYGPAETCVLSVVHEWESAHEPPNVIGTAVACRAWVVDADDPTQLAPIGCLGELVVQGPNTRSTSLESYPPWAPKGREHHRFYRTGDLVSYGPDGRIHFACRKDTQVKIRGLRVELGEIEHNVRKCLAGVRQVAVETFESGTGTALVAFVCFNDETRLSGGEDELVSGMLLPLTEGLRDQLIALTGQLGVVLPRYMVPSIFVPCSYMPVITSAKMDRKTLKRCVSSLSWDALADYALREDQKRAADTSMESRLQLLWAEILNIPAQSIGKDDSFLQLGGDSISAIHLVTASRESGISLSVKDIFDDPRLFAVAEKATSALQQDGPSTASVEPFALLEQGLRESILGSAILDGASVEDACPCTKLQEGLMTLSRKQPGSYVAKYIYKLADDVDTAVFKTVWEQTVAACPNLRTVIFLVDDYPVQAVLGEDAQWDEVPAGETLDAAVQRIRKQEMSYGDRLCRYSLCEEADGRRCFMLTLHHAVHDGWSLQLVLSTLSNLYASPSAPARLPSYAGFIRYITSIDTTAAREYWAKQLDGARSAPFPPAARQQPSGASAAKTARIFKHDVSLPRPGDTSITKASVLRATWALVLARYCDTDDICFGTTVSGRNASVDGLHSMPGPAIATVPIRMRLARQKPTGQFLRDVQNQATEMIAHEQYGLQNISKLHPDAAAACDFTSLLVIQPLQHFATVEDGNAFNVFASDLAEEDMETYFTYPLVFECFLYGDRVSLAVIYNSEVLSEHRIVAMTRQFEHVLQQLMGADQAAALETVSVAGPWDRQQAMLYNDDEPEIINTTVHDLVAAYARSRPDAPAIRAWDRVLTYREFDAAASRLAILLVDDFSVAHDDLVLVCFEKSAWFFVSILAINKAGATWVPLDPSHPSHRHQQVTQQTGARLALSSSAQAATCRGLVSRVLEVTPELDDKLAADLAGRSLSVAAVSLRTAAYVLFTSGSTGTPKGLVMEHVSACTSQTASAARLGLTKDVRMLQFAAFVFDLFIGEIIGPLITGACLCVPSDHARLNELKKFANEAAVNWAYLTPLLTRALRPDDFPGLELQLLAGEVVGKDILDTWHGKVRLINAWGPAETCVFSTLHEWKSKAESPLTVGRQVGGFCWIVDQDDPSQLAPIGCVGEVVIQGPTILRHYVRNPKMTAASIVEPLPEWAPKRETVSWDRFFKSGDLGFYNADGTIEFVSRKDTQIKIRGLRVEPGEIEHHMRAALRHPYEIAVDVFHAGSAAHLVVYMCPGNARQITGQNSRVDGKEDVFMPLSSEMQEKVVSATGKLNVILPRYMVPAIFIPCRYMPFVTSGKLDRKELRLTATLTPEELGAYSLLDSVKRPPETEMERRLQHVWATVLNMPAQSIGRNDSFLRIGGDSIAAIYLVSAAREAGISVTVKDVFDDPRLSAVALRAVEDVQEGEGSLEVQPFSLLDGQTLGQDFDTALREQCGLSSRQLVEDAFPCTSLQQGLMALAGKQPGSYIAEHAYRLPSGIDVARFKASWERTVRACANLRTRIILVQGSAVQVVLRDDVVWDDPGSEAVQGYISSAKHIRISYGSRLTRYAHLTGESGENYFVFMAHHAIFDGWTLRLIFSALRAAYKDAAMPILEPFSRFIRFTQNFYQDAACEFWTQQLQGAQKASLPGAMDTGVSTSDEPKATRMLRKTIDFPQATNTSMTKATILRAAWALVLASHCGTEDICFGVTVSGRNAPVPGVEAMPGLTVATVPVHVRLDKDEPVSSFVSSVQTQASEMLAYEQYGLQNISKISPEVKNACDFTSLLAIQPVQHFGGDAGDEVLVPEEKLAAEDADGLVQETLQNYFSYPLVIQGHLLAGRVDLVLIYDTHALTEFQALAISHQFEHVVQQLLRQDDAPLGSVSVAGDWDLQNATSWNNAGSDVAECCIHDLISKKASAQPEHEAVFSSEGTLAYADLDRMSNALADRLYKLGVRPETKVPFCFEKFMWAVVAVVAILKAGGAFVPLDPSHPVGRRQALVKEVGASVMLASPSAAASCKGMAEQLVELSPALIAELLSAAPDGQRARRRPIPSNAAYVIFTSGSTGKPKGVVMERAALCSSTLGQGRVYGINQASRVLQFSNFIFDGSLGEMLTTLVFGGTVCIPSESERFDKVVGFIERSRVNTAMLTPSFVKTFTPDQVPTLETLILGGEAVPKDVLETWYGRVKVFNGYGPAEACNYSSIHAFGSSSDVPTTIGRGFIGACWIVQPDNHHKLTPIGCAGELLIQSPALARGYLSNAEQTERSFVENVDWLSPDATGAPYRFYLTGDIVRYNASGSMEYLGRKDRQVKMRGQRIELGEIEYHAKRIMSVEHAAVDVLRRESGESLVCFVSSGEQMGEGSATKDDLLAMDASRRASFTSLAAALKTLLPGYMVPSVFLPLRRMPFVSSMKIDRSSLKALAQSLSSEELASLSLGKGDKVAPTTAMELKLRDMWAQVLKVEPAEIGKNDSFLEIGGDSISAIHLTSLAHRQGIKITAESIFQDSRLCSMASSAVVATADDAFEAEPFSLLPAAERDTIVCEVTRMCDLPNQEMVEDVFPCTKLQEGLMALAVKQPGSYIAKHIYKLPRDVDLVRFMAAWEKTVALCGNLRTRIVLVGSSCLQVLVKDDVSWESSQTTLHAFMHNMKNTEASYGSPLSHYTVVKEGNEHYFVWTVHHART